MSPEVSVDKASQWNPLVVAIWSITAGTYLLFALYRVVRGFPKAKLPPGPLLHFPVLGDSIFLRTGNPLLFFFGRFKRYGSVFRTKILGSRIWVVSDWAALRGPLSDQGAMMEIPWASFKALMGESFLRKPGVHGPWRKVMSAAVTGPQLAVMFHRVLPVMRSHLRAWEAAGGKINIYRAARLMGVDLAVDAIMQVPLPATVDRQWFKAQVERFLDGLYSLPLVLPGSTLSRALAAREQLLDAMEPAMEGMHREFMGRWEAAGKDPGAFAALVLERKDRTVAEGASSVTNGVTNGDAQHGGATSSPGTPPSAALPSSPSVSAPSIMEAPMLGRAAINCCEVRDAALSVLHMLVAAGDTTRFALFNTWTLLAMSPRVQDKLYEEQKQVMAQYGEELSYEATCGMPYMDATLKECMRLLPASAGGMRRLTQDFRVGEYVIPKGEMIWYHAGLMHCLDPVLWDGDTSADLPPHMDWRGNLDAAFRPERWLGPSSGGPAAGPAGSGTGDRDTGTEGPLRPRYMTTFGSGLHLCVGMNLVYLEIKMLLALVLRKYRLTLETPDMLERCNRLFPFFVPGKGTDGVLLQPREAAAQAA